MSIIYIILAIIASIAGISMVFAMIGKIEHKNKKLNLSYFLFMLLIIMSCALCMVIIYHAQNDLTNADVQSAYDEGYNLGHAEGWDDGIAEERTPSNEEMEAWFASTQEVVVASNEGGDLGVHIIDANGEEWVLFADSVVK